MRMTCTLTVLCLAVGPARSMAQRPVQAVFTACPTGLSLFTETSVQFPAHFVRDSTVRPRPTAAESNSANVVRFVVDTTGRVEAPTFVAVRVADSSLFRRAQNAIGRWRFEPARATGCHVRQLVVAAITP